jgi:hypothetical protein
MRAYSKYQEKRNESEEQPQSRTIIRRRSRLRRLRFSLERGTRKVWEGRTSMKVKSNLKAGQRTVAVLD